MHKDVEAVIIQLVKSMCFGVVEENRKHYRFPKPKDILNAKDRTELLHWLIAKLPQYL